MTVNQLNEMTLRNCRLAVTDANKTAYIEQFVAAYNEAYSEICHTYIKPATLEEVTLDANKRFVVADLSKTLRSVLSASEKEPYSADTSFAPAQQLSVQWASDTEMIVPDAEASATIWLEYQYEPAALTTTVTDVPSAIPAEFHYLLTYFAAVNYFQIRGKLGSNSPAWMDRYQRGLMRVRPVKDATVDVLPTYYDL